MLRNLFKKSNLSINKQWQILTINYSSNTNLDIEKLEQDTTTLEVIDYEAKAREDELESKRNKSRLYPPHRNILQDKPPYPEPKHELHLRIRYKRKMYGRYGNASGIDPSICWPTKEELSDIKEYERIAFPHTVTQMIEMAKKERGEKQEKILKRQEDITNKLLKLDGWIKDLNAKLAKKEAEAREAKERKERLIEEVRRHFGYTVDPRDDRFKEMLEKKEKEQKKAMKEARKRAKEEKLVTKILAKKDEPATKVVTDENVNKE